jgi:predicted Zn finger-like uncharacterized protein
MKIVCPTCNAIYRVRDEKVPKHGGATTCKKCGGRIVIEPTGAVQTGLASSPVTSSDTSPTPKGTGAEGAVMFTDYPELQGMDSEKFDFREILSPNKKGGYKNRKNNFRLKILKTVHQVVGKILNEGEKVMRIGKGSAYYPAEFFLGNGYLTIMYNHYAMVCTNQRLLLININGRINRITHYLFQMPYQEIKKAKMGSFGSFILYPVKGKRRIFMSMKRYFAKELKQIITDARTLTKEAADPSESRHNLCPSCFVPLSKGLDSCSQCMAHFKEPRKAFFRSLLLPGLGDIYLGHRGLGLLEMLGSAIVWLVVLAFLFSGEQGVVLPAVFLLLFYNGLDGLLTYHMANKGYMLDKK